MYREINLNKVKIGVNLYKLIDDSKFTYDELAEKLGLCSSRVIYEWISGKKLPSTKRIVALSLLFEVLVEDILLVGDVF